MSHNFRKLHIWNDSLELVTDCYRMTESLPSDEKFGLVSQIRRAAVSVSSNIAEGANRSSDKDFVRFLYMSKGSISELITQMEITVRLGMIKANEIEPLNDMLDKLDKSIYKLIQKLKND